VLTRAEVANPSIRSGVLTDMLVNEGMLRGEVRIPNTVSTLTLTADLRGGRVTGSFEINAPREGKSTTRVSWLLRQLKDAPDALRVESFALHQRGGKAELLRTVRENPSVLVAEPGKELKSFTVAYLGKMGSNRLAGRAGFIDSVMDAVLSSYEVIGQHLKDWSAAPPRLRQPDEVEVEMDISSDLPSAALSSQDDEVEVTGEAPEWVTAD